MRSLAGVYERAAQDNKAAVLSLMLPAPGGVIVDVGCGDGSDTIALRDHVGAGTVIGLELADHLVSAARERGVEIRQADLTKRLPGRSRTARSTPCTPTR